MSFWRDMKNLAAVPVPKSAAVKGMTGRQRRARAVRRRAARVARRVTRNGGSR
jgi:hypothetical protein